MSRLPAAVLTAISLVFILALTATLRAGGPELLPRLLEVAGAALGLYVSAMILAALASSGTGDPMTGWRHLEADGTADERDAADTLDGVPAVTETIASVRQEAAARVLAPARDAADELLARTRREFSDLMDRTNAEFDRAQQA